MTYNYKYFISGSSSTYSPFDTTADIMLNEFQENLNVQFYNAPDAFIIQEETAIGSEIYSNVDVRVNRAINSYTGMKLGDDFKTILFRDLSHSAPLGTRYYFDSNYWITINSEIIKNFAASATIRRCNNMLRWIDEYGVLYQEPCSIEYNVNSTTDQIRIGDNPVLPEGYIEVYAQLNTKSNKIKANQRFLFGNTNSWICYKVFGNGTRNFLNQETLDNNSASILRLYMGVNQESDPNDDIVNGICDVYKNIYALSISPSSVTGNPGNTIELVPTLTLNDDPIDLEISYTSSGSSIATTSGSSSNILSLVSSGSCNITGYMTANPDIDCIVPVVVLTSPAINTYEIRVSPDNGIILQGEIQAYTVYLYLNGVIQADTFTLTIANPNVPIDKYTLTVTDGNNFSVTNNHLYLDYPLILQLDSGSHTKQFYIYLQGAW
jgi:hypothetical protein